MKINIVSYAPVTASGWILGKFARELEKQLRILGQDVVISNRADKKYDINHHIIYTGYDNQVTNIDTVMLTHIDYFSKAFSVKDKMKHAKLGICMSKETMNRLAAIGIPKEKLCYVNPAHNEHLKPKKWTIGITSRLYSYGLKRESFLPKLLEEIDSEYFRFKIMGSGWESIIAKLKQKGFEVDYYPDFDLEEYVSLMQMLDYYLYMGEDEGSMGFVDAVFCGVKTIATTQGFHLDAKAGLTHGFTEFEELVAIFQQIQSDLQIRRKSVKDWTWESYAKKHLEIWQHLMKGRTKVSSAFDDGLNTLQSQSENLISKKEAWKAILKTDLRLQSAAVRSVFYRALLKVTPDSVRRIAKQILNRNFTYSISIDRFKKESPYKISSELSSRFSRAAVTSSLRSIDPTIPISWEFAGFSQSKEDGISDYLLSQLKQKHRYFVEIGSSNGLENNTGWLAFGLKYSGLMIDGCPKLVELAKENLRPYNWGVEYLHLFVTLSNTKNILKSSIFKDPDFLSLDIDGNDYYIMRDLLGMGMRPKILVVEYNSAFGPNRSITIPYQSDFSYCSAHSSECYFGASIMAWRQLLESQGYAFVTVESNGVNAFFIDKNCFESSFVKNLKGENFAENFAHRSKHGPGWENHFRLVKNLPYNVL